MSAAVCRGHGAIVEALLKSGADADSYGEFIDLRRKWWPLWNAALNGHLDVIKSLIAAGANVNHTHGGKSDALWAATLSGDMESIEALLAAGAAVDGHHSFHMTGLRFSAEARGNQSMIDLFLRYGAVVDRVYECGRMASDFAYELGREAMGERLKLAELGAKSARQGDIESAQLAILNGNPTEAFAWMSLLPAAARADLSAWATSSLADARGRYHEVGPAGEAAEGDGHVRRLTDAPGFISEITTGYNAHPTARVRALLQHAELCQMRGCQ